MSAGSQQHLLDAMALAICIVDQNLRVLAINKELERWLDRSSTDIVDQQLTELFPHLAEDRYQLRLHEVFSVQASTIFSSSLTPQFLPCTYPDGTPIIQHTVINPLTYNNQPAAAINIHDVTNLHLRSRAHQASRKQAQLEAQKAEAARAASEQNRRETLSLLHASPYASIHLDNDHNILHVNDAWAEIVGLATAELVGRPYTHGLPTAIQDSLHALVATSGSSTESVILEVGYDAWYHFRAAHLHQMPHIAVVITAADISQLKRNETALEHARKEAELASLAKSQFLANMSHEIRTPLNGIIGFCDLLRDVEMNTTAHQYTQTIRECSGILLELVDGVLDFAKIESGKIDVLPQRINLLSIIDQIISAVRSRAAHNDTKLLLDIDASVPEYLVSDPLKLKQILLNILNNACKFTTHGEVSLTLRASNNMLRFDVADSGIGMSPEQIDVIFEPFSQADSTITRRFGGTGLGLTISHKLAQLLHGHIEVESQLDQGTTFSLLLPIVDGKELLAFPETVFTDVTPHRNNQLCHLMSAWQCQVLTDIPGHQKRLPIIAYVGNAHDWDSLLADYADRSAIICHHAQSPPPQHAPAMWHCFADPPPLKQLQQAIKRLSSTSQQVIQQVRVKKRHHISRTPLNILIVEDNAINARLVKILLKKQNFSVHVVTNGAEAVEAVQQQAPDCILMDCQMPVMDGYEATRIIRHELHYEKPIFALTANSTAADHEQCLIAGMDQILLKPLESDQLYEVMQRIVERRFQTEHDSGEQPVRAYRN
jgi:PAS domain S-box-containing protein